VFSLAELEHCVLRGRLCRPEASPKAGYKLPLPDDDRYSYALGAADRRMNFVINSGAMSGPDVIYVLTPDGLEQQLTEASRANLEFCLNINTSARSLVLPRACFLYRHDFVPAQSPAGGGGGGGGGGERERGDDNAVLNECLKYFGATQSENIANLVQSAKQERRTVNVRFREPDFSSYVSLTLQ
jgi:hypothetical protein